MRNRAKKALERMIRPALNYLAPGAITLGYHRISDETWDPLNLAVSKDNFRNHLDVITDKYDPVSLGSLVAMKRHGRSLKGCVSITFDDGYEDFIRYAVPELANRDIPATIFVTTGYTGEPFWWDEVSYLVGRGNRDADILEIDFHAKGGKRVFRNLKDNESAASAVREICDQMLDVEPSVRADVIAQIRGQVATRDAGVLIPRAMTQQQLEELSEIPLVEIAAHSVTHPMLSRLDEADQVREIRDSKFVLETLGKDVKGFSYPNGSYSPRTRDIVEKCGFDYACTSQQAAVRRKSDFHQLPRIWAPNVGGEQFSRWISAWSGLRHRR